MSMTFSTLASLKHVKLILLGQSVTLTILLLSKLAWSLSTQIHPGFGLQAPHSHPHLLTRVEGIDYFNT